MKEVLCLATGETYDIVIGTKVTAHPAVTPYPRFEPNYVIPIKKGGILEFLYHVDCIVECLPEDIVNYKDSLTTDQYRNLITYHTERKVHHGYSKRSTNYRFYLLKDISPIKQPCTRKNIQISVRIDLEDISLER